MRRAIILLLSVILTVLGCEENATSPTIDNHRIKRILNFSNSTSPQPYGTIELTYNSSGNLIKESTLDYPNTLTTYNTYEYSNHKLTKKYIYDGQVKNLTLGSFIKYYYTNDQITKEELFLSDGTLRYTTFYQFERDKLVDTYKVDDTLGVHHHYKYTFDNLRRLSLEEGFMYNLELSEFIKYFYDNSDRLVKSEFYNHEKTLTSYIDKIYIGTSKLPDEELHYDLNKTLTQTRQLTYDNWENLTEVNVIGQGINCRLFKKIYSRQLLTEEIRYNPYFGCTEWTVTRYEYENN